MVAVRVLLAAFLFACLDVVATPAVATDMKLLGRAMKETSFTIAVDMSVKLASCKLSRHERSQTDIIRRAALDVAAERLEVPPGKVRSLASEFAGETAQLQIKEGTVEASCAYHRAWLLSRS